MNIFIHRRDLRINDNSTLNFCIKKYKKITPIFIFDPRQITKEKNKYFSNNCVEFLCDSLLDLEKSYKNNNCKMHFFEGDPKKVLKSILENNKIVFHLIWIIHHFQKNAINK